jgi:hypothetical protein
MLILEGGPLTGEFHFDTIFATISTFKNSVEKTVPKREPLGTQMDAKGSSKSLKNTKK